ncbi:aspartate/glutamate racemase family protein [Pseudooceanicola sp. HF7]|uniref:maleate cis-trans isomerase family protein n=1 Tax=Pseudooceanicola sp. HF7 TaxID=2721560 RepID=UPI0014312540|nr:aspartate/glutamate racemase family protein [Pseudooceanicola sp. HF7]NIZ08009.1 Asp/Glu racemase [Pseudooceanicola sp. HF7]
MKFAYDRLPETPRLGLIVLQADETIETDFRRLLAPGVQLLASRIPSGTDITQDSIAEMGDHLTGAAALLPHGAQFDALAYGCTSASAQIGPAEVARRLRLGTRATAVTEPVSALIAACRALGVTRLALLSPYIAPVSARLREVLAEAGIATAAFGSFEESREAMVARIAPQSIRDAARSLVAQGGASGVFLSCTNLRTLDLIADLEAELDLPVLSSNQVLAWHLHRLAGLEGVIPGRLGRLPA